MFGQVDVEKPAPQCTSSVAAAEALLAPDSSLALALPLHARYPAPCDSLPLRTRVLLPPPVVWLRCEGESEWRPAQAQEQPSQAVWSVPCGDVRKRELVDAASLCVTLLCALLLLGELRKAQL